MKRSQKAVLVMVLPVLLSSAGWLCACQPACTYGDTRFEIIEFGPGVVPGAPLPSDVLLTNEWHCSSAGVWNQCASDVWWWGYESVESYLTENPHRPVQQRVGDRFALIRHTSSETIVTIHMVLALVEVDSRFSIEYETQLELRIPLQAVEVLPIHAEDGDFVRLRMPFVDVSGQFAFARIGIFQWVDGEWVRRGLFPDLPE